MSKTVVILDDTPDSQKLGVAMLGSIGTIVSSVQFTTVAELPAVADPQAIYCPLTLAIPPTFQFWGQSIGRAIAPRSFDLHRNLDRPPVSGPHQGYTRGRSAHLRQEYEILSRIFLRQLH